MSSILFKQKRKPPGQDPIVVAIYSIVPGIGQLHNGKTKKGIIFLTATFVSFLILLGSLNPASTLQFAYVILTILRFFLGFIFKFEFEPSPAAEFLMGSIRFGGTFSTSLLIILIAFILYSMVDAYKDAEKMQEIYDQKLISTDSTMFRFSESTASSYIIHAVAFSTLFLLSLFFVIPTKEKEQITEIEFIMPQIESKKPPPPETKRRSTVQSIDQGKHDPKKEITPPQKSRPASPPPAPRPVAPQPKQVAPPRPEPIPKPRVAPVPVPKVSDMPAIKPAEPRPTPIQANVTETSENIPRPAPEAPDSRALRGSSTSAVAVAPRVPGVPGRGGLGNAGNPPPNPNLNAPPSIAAKKDIDFGPYMEELQRRIKRAWRPPRGNESKRVVVTFKISTDGQLRDLAIKKGSGFEPSDKAALLAVQEAAPFARLPQGAPSSVDIEFTFDYNVFGSKSYTKF